jgi:CRP-like cAMP-binding protein
MAATATDWTHPLFEGAHLTRIAALLGGASPRRVHPHQILSGPGQQPAYFHLLLEGRLESFQLSADGQRLILEIIEPGGVDGLLQVAALQGHFTEAVLPSRVLSISQTALRRVVDAEAIVAVNLLGMMLSRLERREQQLDSLAHRDPTLRIARQLLALGSYLGEATDEGIELRPRLTHQMLADMLGVRRETVTLHLNLMAHVGAVRVRRDHLLLDEALLRRIVAHAPELVRAGSR